MERFLDCFVNDQGQGFSQRDLEILAVEAVVNNKLAHLDYEFDKLMREHKENLCMIETKILMESGSAEDLELLYTTEAQETKAKGKGILGSIIDAIISLIDSLKKVLFGSNDEIDESKLPETVQLPYNPDEVMEQGNKLTNGISKFIDNAKAHPIKAILGIGAPGTAFWIKRKLVNPTIKDLKRYAEQKRKELFTLKGKADNANLSPEEQAEAKKGFAKIKSNISNVFDIIKAIPHMKDPDFKDKVDAAKYDEAKNSVGKIDLKDPNAYDKFFMVDTDGKFEVSKEIAEKKVMHLKARFQQSENTDEKDTLESFIKKAEKQIKKQYAEEEREKEREANKRKTLDKFQKDKRSEDEIKEENEEIDKLIADAKKRLAVLRYVDNGSVKGDTKIKTVGNYLQKMGSNAVRNVQNITKFKPTQGSKDRFKVRDSAYKKHKKERTDLIAELTQCISDLQERKRYNDNVIKYRTTGDANAALENNEDAITSTRNIISRVDSHNIESNTTDDNDNTNASNNNDNDDEWEESVNDYHDKLEEVLAESYDRTLEYGYDPMFEDFDAVVESAFMCD